MRVLIVGGRRWRLVEDATRAQRAEELNRGFAAAGHEVAFVAPAVRAAPSFRKVSATLGDSLHERDVAATVRRLEPHVALVCGLGAGTSARLPWMLAALGIPCAVEVELAAIACHRGDLRFMGREACTVFDDPARCAACCSARAPGGLSALGAAGARGLGWLRASSPFPSEAGLRHRRDEVLAALEDARLVLVEGEAAQRQVIAFGVEPRRVRVGAGCAAADLAPHLHEIARA